MEDDAKKISEIWGGRDASKGEKVEKTEGENINSSTNQNDDTKGSLITIREYLAAVKLDSSIKNEADLIKRYQDKAKEVNLLSVFGNDILGATIRVEFPSIVSSTIIKESGKKGKEDGYVVFCEVKPQGGGLLGIHEIKYKDVFGECREATLETATGGDVSVGQGTIANQQPKNQSVEEKTHNNVAKLQELGNTKRQVATELNKIISFGGNKKKYVCMFACEENLLRRNDTDNPFLTYFFAISETKGCLFYEDSFILNKNITQIVQEISSQIRNEHIKNLIALNQRESIQSAIAALMARNMSHNLGSHPITNTKNYFRNRIEEVAKQSEADVMRLGADYRGNMHLLQYVKERMDFIATVVSGDQYPYGSLNVKAQFFDVLTEDYHGERHGKTTENFLLKYLVFSEKLTRHVGYSPKSKSECNYVLLNIKFKGETYTGNAYRSEEENSLRLELSKLELAVPGGLMGRHALFCIIENIIRNSAKHSKGEGDLEMFIKLEPNCDGSKMDISIFNNRKDGEYVMKTVEQHFKDLVIVKEENGSVDKNCKGLKEMLICALWLRNENVACKLHEIQKGEETEKNLYDIQNERKSLTKIDLIKKYLEVSLVDDKGEKIEQEDEEKAKTANLCYTLKDIPLFEYCHYLKSGEDYEKEEAKDKIRLNASKIVDIHADIVAADKNYEIEDGRTLSDIFPRFVNLSNFNKPDKKKWDEAFNEKNGEVLFRMYDKIKSGPGLLNLNPAIVIDSGKYVSGEIIDDDIKVKKGNLKDSDWTILFKTHLDSKTTKEEKQEIVESCYGRYLESESGENFTSTIATSDFLKDFVNRYKVVEMANTRVAIIDERIFGDFKTNCKGDLALEQKLMEMRGIYLLNYDEVKKQIIDLQGHEFKTEETKIDFVSIHLGLLDKKSNEDKNKTVKIKKDIIKKYFSEKTLVSIHSGRGNFSADLETELKNYPFISLSALEAAFYDCKYFLTQLFKTTNYYGKGNINNE